MLTCISKTPTVPIDVRNEDPDSDFVQFAVVPLTCGSHWYGPHVSGTIANCTKSGDLFPDVSVTRKCITASVYFIAFSSCYPAIVAA